MATLLFLPDPTNLRQSSAQPHLGFPGDVINRLRDVRASLMHPVPNLGLNTVGPGSFEEHGSKGGVACLRYPAWPNGTAA